MVGELFAWLSNEIRCHMIFIYNYNRYVFCRVQKIIEFTQSYFELPGHDLITTIGPKLIYWMKIFGFCNTTTIK